MYQIYFWPEGEGFPMLNRTAYGAIANAEELSKQGNDVVVTNAAGLVVYVRPGAKQTNVLPPVLPAEERRKQVQDRLLTDADFLEANKARILADTLRQHAKTLPHLR